MLPRYLPRHKVGAYLCVCCLRPVGPHSTYQNRLNMVHAGPGTKVCAPNKAELKVLLILIMCYCKALLATTLLMSE